MESIITLSKINKSSNEHNAFGPNLHQGTFEHFTSMFLQSFLILFFFYYFKKKWKIKKSLRSSIIQVFSIKFSIFNWFCKESEPPSADKFS